MSALIAWATIAPPATAQNSAPALTVAGTSFVLTQPDGTALTSAELIGAIFDFQIGTQLAQVRLANVVVDPEHPEGDVLLHDFRLMPADTPMCPGDENYPAGGFPVPGVPDAASNLAAGTAADFELACATGARGKCVRWGYGPWKTASDGVPMRDYFNACVRMVRADYCGDGTGWTEDGTLIDAYDRLNINQPESREMSDFAFEAGWTPAGATCVGHLRIPGKSLPSTCAALAALGACSEASARADGALLLNRSRPNPPEK